MNGLTLRINPSTKKMRNAIGFAPITLPENLIKEIRNELFNKFLKSSSADEQLAVLKDILGSVRKSLDKDVMRLLSLVFLQAEGKHPVKCFLTRHITKNDQLQQTFADELAKEIKKFADGVYTEYPQYIDVVSKIATCIENFPAGALAVQSVEIDLAKHLKSCLECCIKTLSERKLSPTEKNEIYNLSHLALRLLLYIIQKVNVDDVNTLVCMFETFRPFIKYLIFDEDSPMDTKSICGIIFLSMELLENGPDAWISILYSTHLNKNISHLLEYEAAQLALYSAVATVVPVSRMERETTERGQSAIVCLTEKIMAIGERSSSESTFILGVTRTLVQISKMLSKVSDSTGSQLMEPILGFVWGHLEHYMDSVRHLTAQALANIVRYCTNLQNKGDDTGLNKLFSALAAIDRTRKSYYVSLTTLVAQLGAKRIILRLPDVIRDVIQDLNVQAVQASATTALEMLLQKHTHESNTYTIYSEWILPILNHVNSNELDSAALNILENLMAKAVILDENVFNYILPHIKKFSESESSNHLKCVLMLLSVARKSSVAGKLCADHSPDDWKGIIGYDVLKRAAVDAVEETRILSLSLVAESPKTTEPFAAGDLQLVLHYLRYNINAQSPNFRQLTLSSMKKLIKRLEESYKALCRSSEASGAHYLSFVEELRTLCFAGLMPGANYSRRFVALQVLAWVEDIDLNGYKSIWKEDYIDKLLVHLEDSYENNKSLALQILDAVPSSYFQGKKYRMSLDIEDIIREASSLKPTDCVSASYKLHFIKRKLPENILQGTVCEVSEPVSFTLMSRLLREVQRQLDVCRRSVVLGARQAPMYGVLQHMGRIVDDLDPSAISDDAAWTSLIDEIIVTCVEVNAAVACVVNNSSPEGHLPMDAEGVAVTDHGNTGGVVLEDGRPVTAQMVLLCAWRSVKEVSLLLGTISSRLSIADSGQDVPRVGTLSHEQMALIGDHFTHLLAETKHRGAFEQAYVGFTRLLSRLWRCRSPSLHELPRAWLRGLMSAVATPHPARSATRRSAGLPFMIQALVTTELQVHGNPKCLHECITTLLRLARATPIESTNNISNDNSYNITKPNENSNNELNSIEKCTEPLVDNCNQTSRDSVIETRTHSLNILRALFRNSMLEESLAGYVGEGLMVALQGFEGDTWMERNSSTLLFSALMVRVFGVSRDRHSDVPAIRNTMTGRIFFLRYPQLYDFILNKLTEAGSTVDLSVHPSLCPVLVVLGRLYPSSLEGAASTLRLVGLVPRVVACARGPVLATRRLAARAVVPLVSPERYIPHLISMFTILGSRDIERNYCHGILLQVTRLLEYGPKLAQGPGDADHVIESLKNTYWILEQAGGQRPCYVIADEYVKMINLIVWKFPSFIDNNMLTAIKSCLNKILFTRNIPRITSGREVCLANSMYLNFVISHLISEASNLHELVLEGLNHNSYEVVLSTLNYLLILYKNLEVEDCKFQQHLSKLANENVLMNLKTSTDYIEKLCTIFKNNKYLECVQKSLKILTLENNTQKYIVGIKMGTTQKMSDEKIIEYLSECVQNEHENLTHIYLESLCNFVTGKVKDLSISNENLLEVIRVIFACSSSENSCSTRCVVIGFMEQNLEALLKLDLHNLSDEAKFEFKSTLWATMVTILEDDDAAIRQRCADVITCDNGHNGCVQHVWRVTHNEFVQHDERVTHNQCVQHDDRVTHECVEHDDRVTHECVQHDERVTHECVEHDKRITHNQCVQHDDRVTHECVQHDERVTHECVEHDKRITHNQCVQHDDRVTHECVQHDERVTHNECVEHDERVTHECVEHDKRITHNQCVQHDDRVTHECVQHDERVTHNECVEHDERVTHECVEHDKRITHNQCVQHDDRVTHECVQHDERVTHECVQHDWRVQHDERVGRVISTRAACELRSRACAEAKQDAAAILVLLALLDFKSEVCIADELSDEYRVFDQNERYNIFLEESVWTDACADSLIQLCRRLEQNPKHYIQSIIENVLYRRTFDKLCNNNMILFRKMINDDTLTFKNEVVNPKIELFINKLR